MVGVCDVFVSVEMMMMMVIVTWVDLLLRLHPLIFSLFDCEEFLLQLTSFFTEFLTAMETKQKLCLRPDFQKKCKRKNIFHLQKHFLLKSISLITNKPCLQILSHTLF